MSAGITKILTDGSPANGAKYCNAAGSPAVAATTIV